MTDAENQALKSLTKIKNYPVGGGFLECQNCKNQGIESKWFTKTSLNQLGAYIEASSTRITDSMDLMDEQMANHDEIINNLVKALEILNYLHPEGEED